MGTYLSCISIHHARAEFDGIRLCRWENPLIGWTSTADPLESVARATLNFFSQDEAEAFCKKHGWKFEVLSPKEQSETRPRRYIGYGDNFRHAASSHCRLIFNL